MSSPGRNARVFQQLGMSPGAAAGKLRKLVLFRALKKHGENVCVKCLGMIDTPDDLTIEHIKPWEGRSAELFWDLDNVAFSHARCNRPHTYGTPAREVQEGFGWCGTCKTTKPVVMFARNVDRPRGLDHQCKACKNKRNFLRDRRSDSSMVEHLICNQNVIGSSPVRSSNIL